MDIEARGKELLWRRLDESLRRNAKALGNGEDLPDIADIYRIQEMSELHCYLKTAHSFTPMEVNALLRFTITDRVEWNGGATDNLQPLYFRRFSQISSCKEALWLL